MNRFLDIKIVFVTLTLLLLPVAVSTASDNYSASKTPESPDFFESLDIDGNREIDALTDGLLVLRHMFGLTGNSLISGVIGANAEHSSAEEIQTRISNLGFSVDIDNNGDVDALTDGLIILRYLFGLRGDVLVAGVVSSTGQRVDVVDLESHLLGLATLYTAPLITSSSNFKIPENQKPIGTIKASGMRYKNLNFSLSGLDSGDLSISDVGLLSFNSTADYEVKAFYSLKLKVSDGITEVEQDITVTVVDVEEEDFSPDYYSIPEIDPEYLTGRYSVSSCKYDDGEGFKLLSEADLTENQKLALYAQRQKLTISGIQHTIICKSDWEIDFRIYVETWAGQERKDLGIYGVSFFSRIYRDMDIRPPGQAGLWGQWLTPNNSHPFSALGSIEGGIFSADKMGRSYYPKYMASGATHLYNHKSSINGWGFNERRVSCDYNGGVQIANTLLMPPNLISFDENQDPHNSVGGLFFGHAWIALPFIGGKERVDWSNQGGVGDTSIDLGKLSWTFFAEAKNFSGPVYAYVPEFWSRRLDRWNALEVLRDSGWDKSLAMTKPLKDFYAGRISREELMTTIVAEDWYVDGTDNYVYGREDGYYWSRAEDTFGYTPSGRISIGMERDNSLVFKEKDENGDLFIKTFLPKIPSANNLEPFTLSSRSYGVEAYNHFLDFFQGEADITSVNTNLNPLSHPLTMRVGFDENDVENPGDIVFAEDETSDFWSDVSGAPNKVVFRGGITTKVEAVNRGMDVYFDWRNIDDRDYSDYYKVIEADNLSEYQFIKTNEQSVPDNLKNISYENTEAAVSIMPHQKTAKNLLQEEEIKDNTREVFDFEASPYDFSCWNCVEEEGCDPKVYVARLDDGSKVRYRWYRFKDQPTFKKLVVDYPEIYTDEYLNKLQARVENMHDHWINKETDFLSKPETANGVKVNLIEIDHGQIVSPPAAKEKGWVPIVLSVESPYGQWKTDMHNLQGPNGRLITDF
jgi:hypothetical protein